MLKQQPAGLVVAAQEQEWELDDHGDQELRQKSLTTKLWVGREQLGIRLLAGGWSWAQRSRTVGSPRVQEVGHQVCVGQEDLTFKTRMEMKAGMVESSSRSGERERSQRRKMLGLLAGWQGGRRPRKMKTPICPGTRKPLANFLQGMRRGRQLENLVRVEAQGGQGEATQAVIQGTTLKVVMIATHSVT
jgi:hypothetical protein